LGRGCITLELGLAFLILVTRDLAGRIAALQDREGRFTPTITRNGREE
jgi:hypothetical protein